jgi:hypothetical protein
MIIYTILSSELTEQEALICVLPLFLPRHPPARLCSKTAFERGAAAWGLQRKEELRWLEEGTLRSPMLLLVVCIDSFVKS